MPSMVELRKKLYTKFGWGMKAKKEMGR